MKLFEKYNRLNITAIILTFIIGSCTFYFLLHYILIRQLDETLNTERQEITAYVSAHHTLPEIIPTSDQYIFYKPAEKLSPVSHQTITANYDKGASDQYREITFGIQAACKYYLVTVDKPLEETEDLLKVIIIVTIAMIGLILLIGYIINRVVIRRLWKPFYQTIEKVKTYTLSQQQPFKLDKVDIDEFSLLNQSINSMAERVQHDFQSLKDFTGNAAHEMQTPLAIIRSKLDMLMQNEELLQQQSQNIADMEKAVTRLSRLYQSLLLLIKVENRQFVLNEDVQLDKLIHDKLAEYTDMVDAKGIKISVQTMPLQIHFHNHLAEIILNNLIGNALRYNIQGGTLTIDLTSEKLIISNTSYLPQLDDAALFQRFYRNEKVKEEGSGLGLSIVKQICDLAGYYIEYKYDNQRHYFIITF